MGTKTPSTDNESVVSQVRSIFDQPAPPRPPRPPPTIPDHELLSCIGHGAYGEVWLARNVMGTYRAVKIVRREWFRNPRPYERELSGIQEYEPISRTYEGFIDVLHIGINAEQGYFYY